MWDLIIIGGGPAGITAGIFSVRRALKTLILEDITAPSQAMEAQIIDNYPGLPDISGIDFMEKLKEHAKKLNIEIREERVLSLLKEKNEFKVKTEKNEYETKAIIIATGARYRKALIPGESEFVGKGVSYCPTCDAPFYKDKKVAVIGGGDSAVSGALLLKEIGADVILIHRRNELRAVESLQKKLFELKIKVKWNKIPVEIKGKDFVNSLIVQDVNTKEKEEIAINGVFICIGTVPTSELAKDLGIEIDKNGFIKVNKNQETNIKGVFAAGDCCDNPLKQIISACSDGAIASTSAYKYIRELK